MNSSHDQHSNQAAGLRRLAEVDVREYMPNVNVNDNDVGADDTEVLVSPAGGSSSARTNSTSTQGHQSITASAIFQIKDSYRLVYLAFVWFGLAGTVPWNFLLPAENYWQYKFRTVNGSHALDPTRRNSLQTNFGSYFNMASMFPALLGFILCTIYSHGISLHWRVAASSFIVLSQFVVTAAFSLIDTDSWQKTFFALQLVTIVIMSISNAIFQASSFGMAGVLPSKYMRAAMNGQAVGGVLASLIIIITTETTDGNQSGAYYFFSSAIVVVAVSILVYVGLCRNRYYNFHCSHILAMTKTSTSTSVINDDELSDAAADDEDGLDVKFMKPTFRQVYDNVKLYAVSVLLVFVGSLASYPATAILVVSVDRKSGSVWTDKLFLPFACFLLYNCGDLCGRMISSWIRVFPVNSRFLLNICIVRLALVPLLLSCNVQPRRHFKVAFESDVAFVLIMLMISVSNGYLATHCMSTAPRLVRKEHQQMAGILMSFFMTIGICSGAIVAFVAIQFL